MSNLILVVDDERAIRTLVELALSEHYKTETASSGTAAWALLVDRPGDFAAVVLDLSMPGMSGFDVLQRMAADSELAKLPVVVLTAHNDRDSRVDSFVGGGHAFVTKPFDPDDLLETLRSLTQRSEASRQAGRLGKLIELTERTD